MIQSTARPYIPGEPVTGFLPLERYLPPLNKGVISSWAREYLPQGSWLLDPLGSTPLLGLEAARSGYRVLVASNNPILTLLLEVLAAAPTERELQAAFAELASSRRLDERLEVHVQNLYQTECPACEAHIQASGFIWKHGEDKPISRLIHCPKCGAEGEFPLAQHDLDRLVLPGRMELHRARAIERISEPNSPLRAGAAEALGLYLPRALYIISTVLNRIEGLNLPENRRKLLWALSLTMLDAGNMLWGWPEERNRPRALNVSGPFRENNLWQVLEDAVRNWPQGEKPVPVTTWPNLPPEEGGICIYPGRLRAWLPLPKSIQLMGAAAVVPRPSQAFWTFSAVWAGWLWGREAALPLKGALERRRYDWHWHTDALHLTLGVLKNNTPAEMPLFLVCPELVPGFYTAISLAASAAGYAVKGQALRSDAGTAQLVLQAVASPSPGAVKETASLAGVEEVLSLRNEPARYLLLHAAAMDALSQSGMLPVSTPDIPRDTLTKIQTLVANLFNKSSNLVRLGSQAQTSESGWWWLARDPDTGEPPLADRVEMELIRELIRQGAMKTVEVDEVICRKFPGWLTPDREWLEACLESYADQDADGFWRLRPAEQPAARRGDLKQAGEQLANIAGMLGLIHSGENPWEWHTADGKSHTRFYGLASSMIARYVLTDQADEDWRKVILLPGSRAKLVLLKLRQDARLQELAAGWQFVKFRHLRALAERGDLTLDLWQTLLDTDPFSNEVVQERMKF